MEKWLKYIKDPKKQLIKSQEAYFYFLKGIAIINIDINQSEKYLRMALNNGLKFKYNNLIAKLNLATIIACKGRRKEAEILLNEVEELDIYGLLKTQIKLIKSRLKNVNVKYNIQNSYIKH